jgi:predicted AlkP superfamily pyrophosphatase or phosphodiesterase
MPSFVRTVLISGILLCSSFVLLFAQVQQQVRVVLISIDGLSPEHYLHPERLGVKVPTLEALRNSGSFAEAVVGQYPSVTYPSHVSIVTGVRPARHGVVYNTIFDPPNGSQRWYWESSAIRVPTLWDLALARGLKVGAVSWPVTVGARINCLVPEAVPTPPGETTVDLLRRLSTPGLLDQVLQQTSPAVLEPTNAPERDRFMAKATIHIIKTCQPHLTILHLFDTDTAQHAYGKDSPQAKRAFESTDALIGEIVRATEEAGVRDQTAFIITGDHGFYRVHSALQPNVVLREAGLLKTDASGRITTWKAAAHSAVVRLSDPRDKATAQRALTLFRDLARNQYNGIFRIVERSELDSAGAYPEALFVIEPVEGYMVTAGLEGNRFVVPTRTRGNHGYWPSIPAMHTGFIAAGFGVKPGIVIPTMRQIDIAPTIAAMMGLDLKGAEGIPLSTILD